MGKRKIEENQNHRIDMRERNCTFSHYRFNSHNIIVKKYNDFIPRVICEGNDWT